MTENRSQNTPDKVPTFLKFGASPELGHSARRFMTKNAIERLGNKSIVFYSQQVQLLSMSGGMYSDAKVAQQMASYEKLLHDKDIASQKLKLYRFAETVDLGVKGLKLNLILRLSNSAKSALVKQPLFPENYTQNIEVYTKIPRELLLNKKGTDSAFDTLKSDFNIVSGQTAEQSALEAPWQLHLTGAHIFQPPKIQKPVEVVEESEENPEEEPGAVIIDIKQMIQQDMDRRRKQSS